MKSGELPAPPITRLVGFALSSIEPGRVVFEFTAGEEHSNPMAGTHGGILTTVLDSAMGCAIATKLARGQGYTTLELKINFVRPVTHATSKLFGEGRIVHFGSKTATAEGYLRDAEGRLYAHATTTCLIFS
ncbi:MAG: PaaI family thioesterase [Planctomycetes bacterium]|nr:PaaI family thioesterase [Planctomycetota bacterium]